GAAGHRRLGGLHADRFPDAGGAARHLRPPRDHPPRHTGGRPHGGAGPDRVRRARQERAGPLPLLAAARDGRPDAGLGLPALGGDGRGRGLPPRAGLPAPAPRPGAPRRAVRRWPPLDARRLDPGPDPRAAEAAAGLFDDRAIRLRGGDAQSRDRRGRRRGDLLRPRPRAGEERPLPHRRRGDRGDRRGRTGEARRPGRAAAGPGGGERGRGRGAGGAAADDRLLQGRALLRGGAGAWPPRRRPRRPRRGADAGLRLALLEQRLPGAEAGRGRTATARARRAGGGPRRPNPARRGRRRPCLGPRGGGGYGVVRRPRRQDTGLPPRRPAREPDGAGDLRAGGGGDRLAPPLGGASRRLGTPRRAGRAGAPLSGDPRRPQPVLPRALRRRGSRPARAGRDGAGPGRLPRRGGTGGDADRWGLPDRTHPSGRSAADRGAATDRARGADDDGAAVAPHPRPRALQRRLLPRRRLRFLRRAERRADHGPGGDDRHDPRPRRAGALPARGAAARADTPGAALAAAARLGRRHHGRALRPRHDLGHALPALARRRGRSRASPAGPRGARAQRGDRDPGRLPGTRHARGDHRDLDRLHRPDGAPSGEEGAGV
ncbi:MAG: Na(+) H(+) antiporter subunit A, partial [uncultured Thermomicrobiales bacterium]